MAASDLGSLELFCRCNMLLCTFFQLRPRYRKQSWKNWGPICGKLCCNYFIDSHSSRLIVCVITQPHRVVNFLVASWYRRKCSSYLGSWRSYGRFFEASLVYGDNGTIRLQIFHDNICFNSICLCSNLRVEMLQNVSLGAEVYYLILLIFITIF